LQEGNGAQAIKAILSSGPMPHVFMSGAITKIGGSDGTVLQKPFGERELVRAIERLTQAKSAPAQLPAR
jgi:hypothetical protein